MKYLSSFLLLSSLSFSVKAGTEIEIKSRLSYEVTQKGIDKILKKNEAVFDLNFEERSGKKVTSSIKLSYNGTVKKIQPGKSGQYLLKVKPGKYRFQFWHNANHFEVYTDSIEIKPRNKAEIKVYFDRSDIIETADKPVIYLYPQEPTAISIELNTGRDFLFTYPAYNGGWNVKAYPDGTLEQDGKTFGYLFWEGKVDLTAYTSTTDGFVQTTETLTAFFEEKLSHLGLNGKEMQDFITYWVPRMQSHPKHYIRFVLNEEYNQCASLKVSPQPDKMIRVFMLWNPLEKGQEVAVKEQKLSSFKREGFTLVEWGGTEIHQLDPSLTKE